MEKYWAHSARNGTSMKHGLEEHLESTAKLAEAFAAPYDPEGLAKIAALYHDLGKYYHEFQAYLDQPELKRRYRDHSSAGAVYVSEKLDDISALIVCMMILSHHSGLISAREWYKRVRKNQNQPFVQEALERGRSFLQHYQHAFPSMPTSYFDPEHPDMVSLEMRIRMLFSALVDADFLDTEHHFEPEKKALRRSLMTPEALFDLLLRFYRKLEESDQAKLPINVARSAIFYQCVGQGDQDQSFYLLEVPTGLGKTLSSMGFALKHAICTHKKRVIVALPFLSIMDQNASVYKKVFGAENVLEHHSQADWAVHETLANEKKKLAAENWDLPIIVTSTIQLFESLFSNKTSAVRKLHNIADSVIILDEFQMLPLELLEPIFATMEELMLTYNVTFVVSSATPLSFKWKEYFANVGQPIPLMKQSEELFTKHLRVHFNYHEEPLSWSDLVDEVLQHEQALVIVNTKEDALRLYQLLKGRAEETPVYHLSTLMCSKHRQDVLEQIKLKLQNQEGVYLVSTQLIEAGVDIDFPTVFRALAPLDSIIQAAGRCNREGKMHRGNVVIFNPSEGGLPRGTYQMATAQTEIILTDYWDQLHLPQTYLDYFQKLYSLDPSRLDQKGIQKMRISPQKGLDFPQIAHDFRMIDQETVSVVCGYDDLARSLIEEAKQNPSLGRTWFRKIQPYVVNLYENDPVFKDQPQSFWEIADHWFVLEADIYDPHVGLNRTMDYSADQLFI